MERNPKAVCGNCPYWQHSGEKTSRADEFSGLDEENLGRCQHGPYKPRKTSFDWCGQHPDFPKQQY